MDFLKKNFEKVILAAALAVLVATAITLFIRAGQQAKQLGSAAAPTPVPGVVKVDKNKYAQFLKELAEPHQWRAYRGSRGWVGPQIFLNEEDKPEIYVDEDTNKNKIQDDWEERYGLKVTDRGESEAKKDSDGDGFDNEQEYRGGNDPLDPLSRPSYAMKLVCEKVIERQTSIRYAGNMNTAAGEQAFGSVNTDGQEKSLSAKAGDVIAEGYKLLEIHPSNPVQRTPAEIVVVSTLPGGEKYIIKQGDAIVLADKQAIITCVLPKPDGWTAKVRETEWLPPVRTEKFRVKSIDMKIRKVIIVDEAGNEYTIPIP